MSIHTRRQLQRSFRRQKPRRSQDRGMVALGLACFAASGPVIYAGAVAALELGALMGAAGLGLAGVLFVAGLACVGEGKS